MFMAEIYTNNRVLESIPEQDSPPSEGRAWILSPWSGTHFVQLIERIFSQAEAYLAPFLPV